MDIEIKLKLKVKNIEIELSEKDANDLCDALQKLLGRQQQIVTTYPIYIEPWRTRPWYEQTTTVWCSADNSMSLGVSHG